MGPLFPPCVRPTASTTYSCWPPISPSPSYIIKACKFNSLLAFSFFIPVLSRSRFHFPSGCMGIYSCTHCRLRRGDGAAAVGDMWWNKKEVVTTSSKSLMVVLNFLHWHRLCVYIEGFLQEGKKIAGSCFLNFRQLDVLF